jgi:hypothetical protein
MGVRSGRGVVGHKQPEPRVRKQCEFADDRLREAAFADEPVTGGEVLFESEAALVKPVAR